jgi:hypothetical protein
MFRRFFSMAMTYFRRKLNVPPPPGFSKGVVPVISEYSKKKSLEIKYILENEYDHRVDLCEDNECRICSVLECQYNDPTHYSFHGCDRCGRN